MSPTVFRAGAYRFYFFSNEEPRMHVHVQAPTGQAKFWLEPSVALAKSFGLTSREIKMLTKVIKERRSEIVQAWQTHFGR